MNFLAIHSKGRWIGPMYLGLFLRSHLCTFRKLEGLVFENLMHAVKRFVTYSIAWIRELIWNFATQHCFFDTQEMWLSEKDKTKNSMPPGFGERDECKLFSVSFLGRSGLHFLGKKMFVLCVNHTVTKYEKGRWDW